MDLTKSYNELLNNYTEQIVGLENLKAEHSKEHHIAWDPFGVLNSRMFTYDEYLQNVFHGSFCYKEKNVVMPYLVQFMAEFESSSEKDKAEFLELKQKNKYQESLDGVIEKASPFLDFHKSLLKELDNLKYTYKIPFPPKRKNATRQLAQYNGDRKDYFEKIESLDSCRTEVNNRIEKFKKIVADNQL
jgi:hypothetical protein